MKRIVFFSLFVFTQTSFACSHDMVLTVPNIEGNAELLVDLANSKGKVPKPFDLKATFNRKKDDHAHTDHDHHQMDNITRRTAFVEHDDEK